MGLKTFILQEELQVSHAERYMTYIDRYHTDVFLELKQQLADAWEQVVSDFKKNNPHAAEDQQAANVQELHIDIELNRKPEKLQSAKQRRIIEVSPSVKIPFSYQQEQRDIAIKFLLRAAYEVMTKVITNWKEIFNIERRGKLSPWFKITQESHELRLQLALTSGNNHSYRTLYSVQVDYGKHGKADGFDRVYLTSTL